MLRPETTLPPNKRQKGLNLIMRENLERKKRIPVFLAADERYARYLGVAVASVSHFASEEYLYDVRILSSGFSRTSAERIRRSVKPNVKVTVCDMKRVTERISESLSFRLRDYYSEAIYYRMFIPSVFPDLKKAVYIDADTVLNSDIADLYFTEMGDNLLAGVTDESVVTVPVFCDYVMRQIGLTAPSQYINSGVIVLNLDRMRRERIEEQFLYLITRYNFNTVAPDQDYLNFLCKGRIKYLDSGWNKHAIEGRDIANSRLHLIHFNMFNKPWHYDAVPMEEYFWEMAKKTDFYSELTAEKEGYTERDKAMDFAAAEKLLWLAKDIYENGESMSENAQKIVFAKAGVL